MFTHRTDADLSFFVHTIYHIVRFKSEGLTMHELEKKVAVVTGGAGGIGFGICQAFGAAGCEVIVADIDQERS